MENHNARVEMRYGLNLSSAMLIVQWTALCGTRNATNTQDATRKIVSTWLVR